MRCCKSRYPISASQQCKQSPQPPFYGLPWDDSLEQTPAATREITRGQLRVEAWLADRAHTVPLTLKVVEGMHREIFSGVFPDSPALSAALRRAILPRMSASGITEEHRMSGFQTSVRTYATLSVASFGKSITSEAVLTRRASTRKS